MARLNADGTIDNSFNI
ncbi:TPA: hypothetical protein DCZ39_01300 [Patescibacteria group bacterium]|nr:hypothetical protein [Candidatus Gracilibacteria bacterium]